MVNLSEEQKIICSFSFLQTVPHLQTELGHVMTEKSKYENFIGGKKNSAINIKGNCAFPKQVRSNANLFKVIACK